MNDQAILELARAIVAIPLDLLGGHAQRQAKIQVLIRDAVGPQHPAVLLLAEIEKLCTDEAQAKTYHPGWGIKEWLEHIAILASRKE